MVDQSIRNRICELLASGVSMREICRMQGMPGRRSVEREMKADPAFREQHDDARVDQASHYFDQCIEIADSCTDPAKARVQIDARKWVLGRMSPDKYGDKMEHEHKGAVVLQLSQVDEKL